MRAFPRTGSSRRTVPPAKAGVCLAVALAAVLAVLLAAVSGPSGNTGPHRPPAGAFGPPDAAAHRLTLDETFDRAALNGERWTRCYDWNRSGCTNEGNDEHQWYLPGQVSLDDGRARLSAVRQETSGSDGRTYPWRSGMLSTGRSSWYADTRHTLTYGYLEASIRLPAQEGMLPAFWLMPASRFTPPELDVVELLGDPRTARMNVHWADGDAVRTAPGWYGPRDFSEDYHVYALDWTPERLTWYVDGVPRHTVTDPAAIPDVPMEVLFTLAVGYPEDPPPGVRSAVMDIDWLRVWQREER